MKRLLVALGLCGLLVMAGCGRTTKTFEGRVDAIRADDRLSVNCSDEAKKGMKGPIDAIGYSCNVMLTDRTVIQDSSGNNLTVTEIPNDSTVKVELSKAVDIRKAVTGGKTSALSANVITLLSRRTISKGEDIIDALEQRGLEVKEIAVNPDNFFHNYDIDSFLLFYVYGSDLDSETANRIQLALEELKRFG